MMMMKRRRRRIFFYFKVFRGSIDLSHPSCWVALSSATSMMLLLVSWYKNYPVVEGAGMTFPRTTGACHCNDTRAGLGREMTPGGDFPESWISQIPPGQHTGGLSMPTMRQTHLHICSTPIPLLMLPPAPCKKNYVLLWLRFRSLLNQTLTPQLNMTGIIPIVTCNCN